MVITTSVNRLHIEHQHWIRELLFFKEEIKIYEAHLEQLLERNSSPTMKAEAEHFQNVFIVQKEVIDELKHELSVAEQALAGFVYEISGLGLDSFTINDHDVLRERMVSFRKIYYSLKVDFRRFELQWC